MISHNKEIYRKDDSRIYWRLSAEKKKKIKLYAVEKNITMSDVLERAIDYFFDKEEEKENIKKIEEKNYII